MSAVAGLLMLAQVTDPAILRELEKQLQVGCQADGFLSKACKDLAQFRDNKPLGSGPHTLVIAEGGAFTRIEYRTGASCMHARDEARRQIGGSRLQAFCVPR